MTAKMFPSPKGKEVKKVYFYTIFFRIGSVLVFLYPTAIGAWFCASSVEGKAKETLQFQGPVVFFQVSATSWMDVIKA